MNLTSQAVHAFNLKKLNGLPGKHLKAINPKKLQFFVSKDTETSLGKRFLNK